MGATSLPCLLLLALAIATSSSRYVQDDDDDVAALCTYTHNGNTHFDLTALVVTSAKSTAYSYEETVVDGAGYDYTFNFCTSIPRTSRPDPCYFGETGGVIQSNDETNSCWVLGNFQANRADAIELIDSANSATGVTLNYFDGDYCSDGNKRSAAIDVYCRNTAVVKVVNVSEPTTCFYRLEVHSYYGCPTECPITSRGLCDSKGKCLFDSASQAAACVCDEGYSGEDCSSIGGENTDGDDDESYVSGYSTYNIYYYVNSFRWEYWIFFVIVLLNIACVAYICYRKRTLGSASIAGISSNPASLFSRGGTAGYTSISQVEREGRIDPEKAFEYQFRRDGVVVATEVN